MQLTRSFEKKYFKENQKVLIYGAGRYGKLAFYALKAIGIIPYAFIDDLLKGNKVLNTEVISPQYLHLYKTDIVLIASYNSFFDMLLIAQSEGCENIYDIAELIKIDFDVSVLDEYELDEKRNPEKYLNLVKNSGANEFVITHLEMVLTECCTLKCRDCANLMQYYKKPCNLELDSIIKSFDNFLETIDVLFELRLIGGEPFIVKNIDKIIDKYADNKKVKRITIYTNSTLIPNEEVLDSLMKENLSVHMSNYGKISCRVNELCEIFEERKIKYYIHSYEDWMDLGIPELHDYDEKELKYIYKSCFMSKCYTFYRGKFYICPRAAHGERLGFFKNTPDEIVDFNRVDNIYRKRSKLKKLIEEKESIMACKYCNGSRHDSSLVKAAVQYVPMINDKENFCNDL